MWEHAEPGAESLSTEKLNKHVYEKWNPAWISVVL